MGPLLPSGPLAPALRSCLSCLGTGSQPPPGSPAWLLWGGDTEMLSLGVWTSMGALFPLVQSRIREGQGRDWECPRCHTGWLCPPPPPPPSHALHRPSPGPFLRLLHSLGQCSWCRGGVWDGLRQFCRARCPPPGQCPLELGLCSCRPSPAAPPAYGAPHLGSTSPVLALSLLPPVCVPSRTRPILAAP